MPVPEVYVAFLVAGIVVHALRPLPMVPAAWVGHLAGSLLLLAGLSLVTWATHATARVDVDEPRGLVSGGPYRFGRNPMYLGWTLIALGVGMTVNSLWVIGAGVGAFLVTHVVTIPHEERFLQERFGDAYLAYKRRVRRWL